MLIAFTCYISHESGLLFTEYLFFKKNDALDEFCPKKRSHAKSMTSFTYIGEMNTTC